MRACKLAGRASIGELGKHCHVGCGDDPTRYKTLSPPAEQACCSPDDTLEMPCRHSRHSTTSMEALPEMVPAMFTLQPEPPHASTQDSPSPLNSQHSPS